MAIKNLEKIEQPREKLMKYGPGRLSEVELLAVVLRTGPQGTGVLALAKKVAARFKGTSLANASVEELMEIGGLGPAKACELSACFELGRRLLKDKQAVLILSPREVWEQLKDLCDNKKEHFVVFFLDTQNQEIKRELISVGTLNASLVHPREVFEPAIKHLASQIILAHNHPGGSLEPSEQDQFLTKRLSDAGRILGIEILDHVIVSKRGYSSFKEKSLL